MGWGNVRKPFPHIRECKEIEQVALGNKFQCEENVRNFPHVWNWCKEKSIWATDTKNNTLGESFRIWFFLLSWSFVVFRWPWSWTSMPCDTEKPIFLCAGNRLGVRHQPSIWSCKRLTSQAPQVPPGFQAGSTLRSWLCTSTDAQSAGPVLVSSLRKVVICCGPWSRSTTLAMSSWLSGMERNFAEKLDLCYFSFHAADFPSSAVLNSFQELCHRTRRLKSSFARNGYPCSRYDVLVDRSIYALLPADLVSAGPAGAPGAACTAHDMLHAACLLYACVRAREKQRRGMAWARGLPSLVAISPSFRALVSSWHGW